MIVIFYKKKQGGVQLVQLSNCPTFSDQIAEDEWFEYLRTGRLKRFERFEEIEEFEEFERFFVRV